MQTSPTEKIAELLEHIRKVSHKEAAALFSQPWVPGVTMRFLEESERTLLMRLAVIPPLPFASIAEWYKDPKEAESLLKHLLRLRMIPVQDSSYWMTDKDVPDITDDMIVHVEPALKKGIQEIITGKCYVPQALPGTVAVAKPAKECWNNLLNSILEDNNKLIDKATKKEKPTAHAAGASQSDMPAATIIGPSSSPEDKIPRDFLHDAGITSARRGLLPFGFEFMLKDTRTQVLLLLDTCLRKYSGQGKRGEDERDERTTSKTNGVVLVNVLSGIMWLSTLKPGCSYSYMDPELKFTTSWYMSQVLDLLECLGLVCLDKAEKTLSVTPLLANSVDVRRGFECAESAELFEKNSANIIVESNFNVYAYTSNPRNISLLDLFTRNEKALPGFYVAKLTREAVQRAIRKGITRQLIEDFLTNNAHPCLVSQKTVIPENVVDQLVIWEKEKERYEFRLASRVRIQDQSTLNFAIEYARKYNALLHYTADSLYVKMEFKEELLRTIN